MVGDPREEARIRQIGQTQRIMDWKSRQLSPFVHNLTERYSCLECHPEKISDAQSEFNEKCSEILIDVCPGCGTEKVVES